MKSFRVLGLMSGTSLDGLDIVDVEFTEEKNTYKFNIHNSQTFPYPEKIKTQLTKATKLSGIEIATLDVELGRFYGHKVHQFMESCQIKNNDIDFVSSHGHTIFHQPHEGITLQIGNGPEGAILSKLKWICDFRTKDVALGGNGAPLVPIGDQYLFQSYADSFLNIGGFANISYFMDDECKAFDICPANIILNHFAKMHDLEYDENGRLGRKGKVNSALLTQLDELNYYNAKPPKSLGIEWVEKYFFPIIKECSISIEDKIATCYDHIGKQIAKTLNKLEMNSVFLSGGGAKNNFLIELLNGYYHGEIILPENEIIEYKEAIIFGLLGVLRYEKKYNCLSSVTGASENSISGIIHYP